MIEEDVQLPLFIVGSARSGTSIVAAAFLFGLDIPGFREGHFFSQLDDIHRAIARHYESRAAIRGRKGHVTLADIPRERIWEEILQDFKALHDEKMGGKILWYDKTPDFKMIRSIPFVREIYREARFVFMKRRGIENVVSRLKKFPNISFRKQCELWSLSMSSWAEVRTTLPQGAWIEIEQRDVALDPAGTASLLTAFLQLPAYQREVLADYFRDNRPQHLGGDETSTQSLDSVGWGDERRSTFRDACGEMMHLYGYSLDGNYSLTERQKKGGS